jgi:hypothetical protein
MDFTFLFLVVLMVLAAQSNNYTLLIALFALLLLTAKSKYLMAAAIAGLVLSLIWTTDIAGPYKTPLLLGGLFLVLLLLVKSDNGAPQPMAGGYY